MIAPSEFEWDEAKAASNVVRHGISFQEAIAVFSDPRAMIVDTTRSEDGEARAKVIGLVSDRLYTVVYTMRRETCRIISARRVNASERRQYDGDR